MELGYPFRFSTRGRTADAGFEAHIRELIEQVLFTAPGERVNRPDFGTPLLQLVFAPASPELAATTRFMVEAALQRWLGELIQVDEVAVTAEDATLRVRIDYRIRRTGARASAELSRPGGA